MHRIAPGASSGPAPRAPPAPPAHNPEHACVPNTRAAVSDWPGSGCHGAQQHTTRVRLCVPTRDRHTITVVRIPTATRAEHAPCAVQLSEREERAPNEGSEEDGRHEELDDGTCDSQVADSQEMVPERRVDAGEYEEDGRGAVAPWSHDSSAF